MMVSSNQDLIYLSEMYLKLNIISGYYCFGLF